MFNDDQISHMRYLANLPRDEKCVCGWNRKGDCFHPLCVKQTEEVRAERAKESKP